VSFRAAAVALAVAALSLLVVAPAPSYDPWAWLLWGREVAGLHLSTAEGPAFKPLPVALCALLAPLGNGAAPVLWVLLARWGAALAVVLAYGLARTLAGCSRVAGAFAAAGVALTAGYAQYAASGSSEGLLLALVIGAVTLARSGRLRVALVCAVACALLRVEAWPFAAAYGAWLWVRRPAERPFVAAAAVAVPALWLVPELLGSGDLLRSGERARVPNPGQPALAGVPAWASVRAAVALPLWPVWIAAAAALVVLRGRVPRAALGLAAAGGAWIALVAAMAQLGFSGEPRYALPGPALLAVAVAAATPPLGRSAVVVVVALLVVAAVPRLDALEHVRESQRHQAHLAADLRSIVAAAGGRDAVLACGRPYVGPLRGPLLAYALDVEKRRVGFAPRTTGVVFASRRTPASPVEPAAPATFRPVARNPSWTLRIRCAEYTPAPCSAGPSPSSSPPASCSGSPPAPRSRIRVPASSRWRPPASPGPPARSASSASPTA
jgi:hypothetical protein